MSNKPKCPVCQVIIPKFYLWMTLSFLGGVWTGLAVGLGLGAWY